MSKYYYAFEFASGLNTTTGEPNKTTGRLSIAGNLAIFTDKAARNDWVYVGKTTTDMQGNCRAIVNKAQARDLHKGMSVEDYQEMVLNMLDYEVRSLDT